MGTVWGILGMPQHNLLARDRLLFRGIARGLAHDLSSGNLAVSDTQLTVQRAGEDSDLALASDAPASRVYVQPLSRVVHHERTVSSGTGLSSGAKAHQVAGTTKHLRAGWKNRELQEHQPPGTNVHLAVDRGTIARILAAGSHATPTDQASPVRSRAQHHATAPRAGLQGHAHSRGHHRVQPRYTADLQRIGIEVLYLPHA